MKLNRIDSNPRHTIQLQPQRGGPTRLRPLPFAGSHGGHLTGTRTSESGGDSDGAHGAAAQPCAGATAAVTTSDSSALKRARAA
jgi:hypothetical protein